MSTRRTRAARILFASALLLTGVAAIVPAFTGESTAAAETSVSRTVTATRTFIDQDGTETVVSSNKVTLQVSQTENLRGRQEIHVSWSGAVPTGGIVGDPNSSDGRNQEYPFVLLECRGVDTQGQVEKGQVRLSPETCWTQTSTERYLAAASQTPSWRFDAYADADEREAIVGRPDPLPEECAAVSEPLTAHWLPFRAAGGEVYYGGPDPSVGCMPMAPESDSAEAGGLPSNTTYGITGTDGRGETDFAVWTAAENASLGCSPSVDCALVAVPIVGVSCDAWGADLATKAGVPLTEAQLASGDATCRRTGAYEPGTPRSSETTDQAVRGNLWWAESNWRNRITVPLHFAASGSICDVMSDEPPVEIMGSVVANELTASWRPAFCTDDDLFTFTHVQQADGLARQLVNSGEIDAALTTAPPAEGYQRPLVQAPIAFGGFAIAFSIDDATQQRREDLKLNARLVAKLLTMSYPSQPMVRDNHPSIGGNPLNITLDPEFQQLNPGLPESSTLDAAAALQVFSSSTDLVWALTSWINADPEARRWLNGEADPWGMTVNGSYQDIALPVDNWPLLDGFLAPQWYIDQNACYANSPTPFMQLISNPPSNMAAVLLNMQFASSAAATVCRYDGYDPTTLPLRQQGRQTVGYRFVLGLVSLSAAERYNLRTAALETAGGTFVKPDSPGLKAAAGLLKADDDAHVWGIDYQLLGSASKALAAGAGAAYPGAMPIYAVVPTSGLDEADATKFAQLLCYAGDEGQVSGRANGQLPPGYLPLTDANGLGDLRDYTLSAVSAVRAQGGTTPALDAEAPSAEEACDFRVAPAEPSETPSTDGNGGGTPVAAPPVAPGIEPGGGKPGKGAGATDVPVAEASTVLTSGQNSAFGRVGVPGILIVAIACAIAGALMRWWDPLEKAAVAAGPKARKLSRSAFRRGKRRA